MVNGMWRLFITLYLSLAGFISVFSLYSSEFILRFEGDMLTEDRGKDIRGWLNTLDVIAKQAPTNQWQSLLEEINRGSSFPVYLLSAQEAKRLSPQVLTSFTKDRLYFIDIENYEAFYQLAHGAGILRLGPMINEDGGLVDLERSMDYIFLFLLACVVLCWHLGFRHKLLSLERAVVSLGKGDLSAKASEKPGLRIGQLNRQFNQMAKRLEHLINGNRQLTNSISHELRSPIARLRCEIDLVEQAGSALVQKNYIDCMSEDIAELEGLVDEILYFSRMESTYKLAWRKHNLKTLLDTLMLTWEREIVLTIRLKCGDGFLICIEKKLIERALNNLVRNAACYGRSQIDITVELTAEKQYVVFSVDDDGPGIDIADRERVFEPFFRTDQSRTRETGGYGLGLAIVRQIAQRHEGSVRIKSSLLGGARFEFSISNCLLESDK